MMDWQEIASLIIVALAATLLGRQYLKRRRMPWKHSCEAGCNCSGETTSTVENLESTKS